MDEGAPDDPLSRLWSALLVVPPPARVPDDGRGGDRLAVLLALLGEAGAVDAGEWRLEDLRVDPEAAWREMVAGRDPAAGERAWRIGAARLVPVGRGDDGAWLLADAEADPAGRHRVYTADADAETLHGAFADVDDLARWVLDAIDPMATAAPALPTLPRDAWSRDPASADATWALFGALHPATFYHLWRLDRWAVDVPPLPAFAPDAPGARRVAVLWSLAHFATERAVALPPGVAMTWVSPEHRALLDNLEDLRGAMGADDVPALVAELALDDDEALAAAASDWMDAFDRARSPGAARDAAASAAESVLTVLRRTLADLVERERLEVDRRKLGDLAEALLEVAMTAPSPAAVPRALTEALVDTALVDEVYADDDELAQTFARALGL